MKRRDLLKLGAAATAGSTLGGPGCVSLPRALEGMAGVPSPESFLAMLDRQLPVVERANFVEGFVADQVGGTRSPEVAAVVAEKDALFRRMLRTLLVTQSFRDLPPETQLHPAVQERMMGHLDEVSDTVFEVSDMLAALDEDQRSGVRRALRVRPDLPMSIAETIDRHAAGVGISMKRRLQLRHMMSQSAFRMRHSDPGAVIDEYVTRVERFRPHGDHDPAALDLARRLGERAFWRYQKHLAAQGPPSTAPATQTAPAARPEPAPRRGKKGMKTGVWLMGIGVVVFALSALVVESEADPLIIGVTLGAVAFAVGFITLIIAAIIYAASG